METPCFSTSPHRTSKRQVKYKEIIFWDSGFVPISSENDIFSHRHGRFLCTRANNEDLTSYPYHGGQVSCVH
jgi:hypothetical protein